MTSGARDFDDVIGVLDSVVSETMNIQLQSPVSNSEINKTTKQLGGLKAPSEDGFPGMFYQKYWSLLGSSVCKAVRYFFETGNMLPELNKTLVVLIPKTSAPDTLAQFRPISLCNLIYRIISKILESRLKPLMSKIILPQQSAFIPRRQIQDCIVVANEAFYYIRNKKRGKQNVMALKVDLNKAFDRVEWDFLLAVLRKMGFGDLWCNWIRACLTTYELEFMVNGDSVGVIKTQRGLRQGDPVSPYLFIIVADVLSRQISKAMTLGTLSGIKMARTCPLISHIFFADDSLFLMKASNDECRALVNILNSYCRASGQTVNFGKSSAFFSPNTPSSLRNDICSALQVQQMDSNAKYLGLPSIFGQRKTELFGFLLDKVLQKLQGWKQKVLSLAGCEVLIKSVIQAIPTYAMQCFLLPVSLLNKLMVYVRRFFWGGDSHERHIHWKNWKKLSQPKQEGGLGYRDFEAFNIALLAKQGWRLLINPNAFWGRILKGIYFLNSNFLVAKRGLHPSWLWSSLLHGRNLLLQGVRWQVGNGQNISFWTQKRANGILECFVNIFHVWKLK